MFCACGCGQQTTLAPKTDNRRGYTKGEPRTYIHNHHFKGKKFTPEHREHISIGQTGRRRGPGIGGRKPGFVLSEEAREKLRQSHRKPWNPDTGSAPRNCKIPQRQFWKMIEDQNGACAICFEIFTRMPRVDHNHSTGEIRMLLCNGCNSNFERIFQV